MEQEPLGSSTAPLRPPALDPGSVPCLWPLHLEGSGLGTRSLCHHLAPAAPTHRRAGLVAPQNPPHEAGEQRGSWPAPTPAPPGLLPRTPAAGGDVYYFTGPFCEIILFTSITYASENHSG